MSSHTIASTGHDDQGGCYDLHDYDPIDAITVGSLGEDDTDADNPDIDVQHNAGQ
jgi:hypothetical protein